MKFLPKQRIGQGMGARVAPVAIEGRFAQRRAASGRQKERVGDGRAASLAMIRASAIAMRAAIRPSGLGAGAGIDRRDAQSR